MADGGTARTHATEPWAVTRPGPCSLEEAKLIAQRYGVELPEYIYFCPVPDDEVPPNAHAIYLDLGSQPGPAIIRWEDCLNHSEQVPVRVRESVFQSDEAIVAVFAHEVHEITNLRALFHANNGRLAVGRVYNLISPETPGNLHAEAVDIGDGLVRRMRGSMMTIDTILTHYKEGRMTRRESVAALGRLVTAESVAEIMSRLPGEFALELQRWADSVPGANGVVVGANLSAAETRRIAEQERIARQVIREWAARNAIPDKPPDAMQKGQRDIQPFDERSLTSGRETE